MDNAFMRCPPLSQKAYFADFPALVTPIHPRNGSRARTSTFRFPTQKRGPFIEPVILRHHLVGARVLVADEAEDHQHERVDDVVVQREHRAVEQRVMDEADQRE